MTNRRDWGGLGGIRDEAKSLERDIRQRPILACPIDGTPLQVNSQGIGNCPMGNWRGPVNVSTLADK